MQKKARSTNSMDLIMSCIFIGGIQCVMIVDSDGILLVILANCTMPNIEKIECLGLFEIPERTD